MKGPYDDIIHLPHHVSDKRPQMPMQDRAAQFSPFAALTGYSEAVAETARLTDEKMELDETEQAVLDRKQRILMDALSEHPAITVTYFQKDERKAGGAYRTVSGKLKKIDEFERTLILTNGEQIRTGDICDIESELFQGLE